LYVKVQNRHGDMVHQDWPFGKAECDEHGQYAVRREAYSGRDTNLAPPFARNRQEHRPRAYTIVYRYAAPINMPVHCSRFTRK
jgi:hypothetical protein